MTPFQIYRTMQETTRPESAADLSAVAAKSSHTAHESNAGSVHGTAAKDHEAAQIAHTLRAEKSEGKKKKYHEMMAAHHEQVAAHHKSSTT